MEGGGRVCGWEEDEWLLRLSQINERPDGLFESTKPVNIERRINIQIIDHTDHEIANAFQNPSDLPASNCS
jgi:hypothetical protein